VEGRTVVGGKSVSLQEKMFYEKQNWVFTRVGEILPVPAEANSANCAIYQLNIFFSGVC